mgnify:CR=1 FL=1
MGQFYSILQQIIEYPCVWIPKTPKEEKKPIISLTESTSLAPPMSQEDTEEIDSIITEDSVILLDDHSLELEDTE